MDKNKNNKRNRNKKSHNNRWILLVSFWTFILAIFFSLFSQLIIRGVGSLALSFLFLLVVIFLGITSDTIGTAAAAAREAPLHAKASKKVPGAQKGVYLVQNAEMVANICNDVIGDIAGVISGVIGANIIFQIALLGGVKETYLSVVMTGFVAALTVGGKAIGKTLAINQPTIIILFVGKVIARLEKFIPKGKAVSS